MQQKPVSNRQERINTLNKEAWDIVREDAERAIELSTEAKTLATQPPFSTQTPYVHGLASAFAILGRAYYYTANYESALSASLEVLTLLHDAEPTVFLSRAYATTGGVYRLLGNFSGAIDYYLKQLDIAKKINELEEQAVGLLGLGTIYTDLGEFTKSLDYLKSSLELFQELKQTYWIVLLLNNLSDTYMRFEQPDKALEYALESSAVLRQSEEVSPRLMVTINNTISEIFMKMGDVQNARAFLEDNIKITHDNNAAQVGKANALRLLGTTYLKEGNLSEATQATHQSLDIAKDINVKQVQYLAHKQLSEIHKQQGDFAQALHHYEQFHTIREITFNEESVKQRHNLEVLYETRSAQKEAELFAELYESEQSRRELAEILQQVGNSLTSTLDLSEVLDKILQQLDRIVAYDRGSLLLLRGDRLHFMAARGYGKDQNPLEWSVPLHEEGDDRDVFWRIYQSKEPLAIEDVNQHDGWKRVEGIATPGSWLGIPLLRENAVRGMLSLARNNVHPYSGEEISLATTFAAQAAIALENAQLYDRVQRFNQQMEYEVRQRTSAVQDAYVQVERLDRTKSNFIAITAHELRTPITVIKGYGQLLQNDPSISSSSYHLDVVNGIVNGTNRMYEIINTMLMMVKIDSRELEIRAEPTSMSRIVRYVTTDLAQDIADRKQTLIVDSSLEKLPPIVVDTEALGTVLSNLLMNAIKYTPDGGQLRIHGRHWHDTPPNDDLPPNALVVTVSDTGIGIDPNSLELIFTKFYQTGEVETHSSGRTKFKGGGPGLGLAISRGIVEAHRGRLWAESEAHDEEALPGSHFHLLLPIRPQQA